MKRLVFSFAIVAGTPAAAQLSAHVYTSADYDRASSQLAPSLASLVVGGSVTANWLPDGRFWYRNTTANGAEQVLVDPATKSRTICDATRRNCPGVPADTTSPGGGRGGRAGGAGRGSGPDNAALSPDGKRAAFIKDWNLWLREVATGQEKQLTTDGAKDFGYATDNSGWAGSDRAILLWSPDSKKIATSQQDERHVGEMYLVETKAGHPSLKEWKYPLPGDSVVAMLQRVIIDVDGGRVIRLQQPPDFHRSTIGDNITMADYNWSPDGSRLAFVSTSRDHKQAIFKVADATTGAVRTVFQESAPTHFESRTGWRMLWATNEIVWYSQREDWGQLYLYDLNSGKLINRITSGEGPVTQIARLDERTRAVWYAANGREKGQDPYFAHFYRIGLDGQGPQVSLTPDNGDHAAQLSPDGRYLIDTYSKADVPPVVTLRDAEGTLVMPLEKAEISRLLATGWKPPIEIKAKAADGTTDLYGMMFVPRNLEPGRKYPIINNAYPGPQSGSVGARTFTAARGDKQALAELGFIVVSIDGRGTPGRSKSFHDSYYGRMGRDNTIPDQIAAMKDLAKQYPGVDLEKAAMWGHSGGGFITADALFRFPDFFKVGIAESGNHDQRQYEDDWGERYQGLLEKTPDGKDSYDIEANQTFAKNLKGHLLLAHGTMDNNVPPYNTLLVADALIKANKDFDLLMLPNQPHGYGNMSNYMMRRRWDYFVKYLLNAEPPKEYEIKTVTRPVP